MSRHTGFANLPLHPGKAPAWLFGRMTRLAREIACHLVVDRGPEEMLRRLADPFWFQAFGCMLGFDWHSSGVTTTVTGALEEGIKGLEHELGLFAQGGKGMTSRRTLPRSSPAARPSTSGRLVHASRMAAKVDSAAVQDGYQLYHHAFCFTRAGHWSVVQQGMSDASRTARRYHWLSESLQSFVNEPHQAICSDVRGTALNLVAAEHDGLRRASVELAAGAPERVMDVVKRHVHDRPRRSAAASLRLPFDEAATLDMPSRHPLLVEDIDPRHLHTVLLSTYDGAPEHFEALLGLEGVGARTLRALALVSEVIRGTPASTRDPCALRVRARRQGRDALSRRPGGVRPDDRRAASGDGSGPRRSQREGRSLEAPATVRSGSGGRLQGGRGAVSGIRSKSLRLSSTRSLRQPLLLLPRACFLRGGYLMNSISR